MGKENNRSSSNFGCLTIIAPFIRLFKSNTHLRQEFGREGHGDYAFELLSKGTGCEARINGKLCNKPSVMTVDCDIMGTGESFPVCSTKCAKIVMRVVDRDLAATNRQTAWGTNGHGRGRHNHS